MRAIKIDPVNRRVEAIDTKADLADLYRLIECHLVEAVYLGDDQVLWLDEEGLLHEPTKPFFAFRGHEDRPFCGHGIILGSNEGENIDTTLSVPDIHDRVVWLDIELVGMEEFEDTVEWMGEPTPVFGSRPIYRKKGEAE